MHRTAPFSINFKNTGTIYSKPGWLSRCVQLGDYSSTARVSGCQDIHAARPLGSGLQVGKSVGLVIPEQQAGSIIHAALWLMFRKGIMQYDETARHDAESTAG